MGKRGTYLGGSTTVRSTDASWFTPESTATPPDEAIVVRRTPAEEAELRAYTAKREAEVETKLIRKANLRPTGNGYTERLLKKRANKLVSRLSGKREK